MIAAFIQKYRWMIIPALVAIITGAGIVVMPPFSDDLGYMMPFRDIILNGDGDWWNSVCESVDFRYHYDNPRIANVVMILIAAFPRVIPAIISIIALAYIFYAGIRFADIRHRPILTALFIASIIVFFPWVDQLYLIDFQLNYLWATALSLGCILSWYNSKIKRAFSFLLGVFVASWHEGFGIPLAFTLAGLLILYPRFRVRSNLYNLTGLITGSLYLISSPGFLKNACAYFENRAAILYPFAVPAIIFVLTWLFMIFRPQHRKICLNSRAALSAALSLSGTAMMLIYPTGPRSGALGITFGCLGAIYLWSDLKWVKPIGQRASKIAISIIYGLIFIHLIYVDLIAVRISHETRQALEAYRQCPDTPHFIGMTLREEAPLICMQKPYYGLLAHYSTVGAFNRFYGIDQKPIMIIPKAAICSSTVKAIQGSAKIESQTEF